jgi:myosin heavy subunit
LLQVDGKNVGLVDSLIDSLHNEGPTLSLRRTVGSAMKTKLADMTNNYITLVKDFDKHKEVAITRARADATKLSVMGDKLEVSFVEARKVAYENVQLNEMNLDLQKKLTDMETKFDSMVSMNQEVDKKLLSQAELYNTEKSVLNNEISLLKVQVEKGATEKNDLQSEANQKYQELFLAKTNVSEQFLALTADQDQLLTKNKDLSDKMIVLTNTLTDTEKQLTLARKENLEISAILNKSTLKMQNLQQKLEAELTEHTDISDIHQENIRLNTLIQSLTQKVESTSTKSDDQLKLEIKLMNQKLETLTKDNESLEKEKLSLYNSFEKLRQLPGSLEQLEEIKALKEKLVMEEGNVMLLKKTLSEISSSTWI